MRKHLRPALVRLSTKSYLCADWRGMGKRVVISNVPPSYVGWGAETANLVALGGVLSLKNANTDLFQSLFAAPETRNNTPNPRKSVVFLICPLQEAVEGKSNCPRLALRITIKVLVESFAIICHHKLKSWKQRHKKKYLVLKLQPPVAYCTKMLLDCKLFSK